MNGPSLPHTELVRIGGDKEPRRARVYIAAFVAGAILSVASFYAALGVLRAMDRLPPPPVSGTWCIDSRFAWLRENPGWKNAGLIAVGSSATLRNLDFGVTPSETQERGVVNAAPCFLTVNQTRYLTEFLVERASKPETVMMVLAPRDFQGCSRNPTAFFDPDLVDQFIAGKTNKAWLRFRNFRLKDIFFHAIYARERRPQLQYDQFGSGPLTSEMPDTGYPFAPEPRCYSELTRLAKFLDSRGVQFIAVTLPVMQGWAQRYDRSGAIQASFASAVESALASTEAILVDGMADWRVPDSGFTDPVHLQWPEAAAFTRFVWKAARQQGADLPPLKGEDAHKSELDDGSNRAGADNDRWEPGLIYRIGFRDAVLPDNPASGRHSEFAAGKRTAIAMLDAITQNTPGYSEAYPVGVPKTYSWCNGSYKPPGYSAPPSNFTAVTGWGQVYPKAGAPAYSNPDGSILIANAKTYVHRKATREWVLVQDQATEEISGAHFVSDFKPKPGLPMRLNAEPDGSVAIGIPPAGYNDHFWIVNRGTYAAGSVDGVYVQMDMRTNDPDMKFVANVGADWWRDASADYVQGFRNNPGAGMSNWVELSTQWSTLRFYSAGTSQLRADPPPELTDTTREEKPPIIRSRANTPSPCLARPYRR
jgi:hypothetical protein